MPVEPDHSKIEELLKAYARKRREQGGDGFELHPATRKLLQAEVARLKPKPAADESGFVAKLIRFWPRIAFAAAAVVMLSVLLWNQGRNRSEEQLTMAKVSNESRERLERGTFEESASSRRAGEPMKVRLLRESDADEKAGVRGLETNLQLAENAPKPTSEPEVLRGDVAKKAESRSLVMLDDQKDRAEAKQKEALAAVTDRVEMSKALSPKAANFDYRKEEARAGGVLQAKTPQPLATVNGAAGAPSESQATFGVNYSNDGASSLAARDLGRTDGFGRSYALGLGVPPVTPLTNSTTFYSVPAQTNAFGGATLGYDAPRNANGVGGPANFFAGGTPAARPFAPSVAPPTPPPPPTVAAAVTRPAKAAPSPTASLAKGAPYGQVQQAPIALAATDAYQQVARQVVRARFINGAPQRRKSLFSFSSKAANNKEPLSQTFDVEQEGPTIAIVDFDGSVYNGSVVPANDAANQRALGDLQQTVRMEAPRAGVSAEQIAFTVSGTNRTLRKLVLINGWFSSDPKNQARTEPAKPSEPTFRSQVANQSAPAQTPALQQKASSVTAQQLQVLQSDVLSLDKLDASVRLEGKETHVQANRVSP